MINSEKAFLYAIKSFPKWMSIRKNPRTSNGGKYLKSLLEEQDNINDTLQNYIKDYFLATYIGREDTILDYGYIAQVGNIDIYQTTNELNLKITDDAKCFLSNRNTYCLFQDGYIILDPINVPEDLMFYYTYNDFKYASKLTKVHIWNVFDEFAMMSSLERFENETNKELMQRCFASFKNKPNSTEQGIKNTIINTLINYIPLSNDDIKIETLNKDNIYLEDKTYGNIYERLAQFNKDFFRTKIWDISLWEHNFKQLSFIPNDWDAKLDFYQIGTGQNNDLITKISDNNNNTTDLQITGYEASQIVINDYIHKHNITKEIPLKLFKYTDELKSKTIEYRILASEVTKIEPTSIYLKSSIKKTGESICYLENIVNKTDNLTVINPGKLSPGNYKLKFLPKNDYASMNIYYADIINGKNKNSLLKENKVFKFKNGILQNIDVLGHINSLAELKTYSNIIEKNDALTIGPEFSYGELSIDVSSMSGKPLVIKTSCKEVDYTADTKFVTYDGFVLKDNILTAYGTDSSSNIVIDLDCSSLSFEFLKADNPSLQGTVSVLITVDNEIDKESGLWTSAKTYSKNFNKFCHVHVEIQKTGMNAVSIKNIMASRYKITKWLDYGELITTPFNILLPNYDIDIKNSLHIKIESFSSYAPIIEYIHIGSSVKYASYEIDNINISDNDILKLYTDCKVELYLNNELINNNFTTYNIYKNETSNDVLLEIDTSGFISIVNSSKDILTTNYGGKTINYITINPNEEISSISINGIYSVDIERKTIYALLNLNEGDIVYVCSNSNGFIVVSENKQEKICYIDRKNLSNQADYFTFENLPNNITGCFILDQSNNIINNSVQLDRNFECVYLVPINYKEYIAYNSETTFTSELFNIDLVNTFSPLLDMSLLMFYKIDQISFKENTTSEATVNFIKMYNDITEYTNWSLGNKKLRIVCNFDFSNVNEYATEAKQIKEIFTLSNVIELDEEYTIDGKTEELSRYIVIPPDDMLINYDEETVSEDIIVEDDLFNKLYYSNVTNISTIKINSQIVSNSICDLINDAGIIVWKDSTYVGQKAQIMYTYQKPISLSYKSLDSLYEIIGYVNDAYKIINDDPIKINNSKDGDKNIIDFDGKIPDKIIVTCSNPNFEAIINDNVVITKLINNDTAIMVKTGYYYDNIGKEYYFFEHMKSDPIDKLDCIELHYVKRTVDFLQFIQESTNHVLDSSMTNFKHTEELCYIDLAQKENILGISSLNSLSACDSFQKWINFNINVSISNQFNAPCLKFEPISSDNYALLELDLSSNKILSIMASSLLEVSIFQEIKLNGDSMTKSIFAKPYKNMINVADSNIYYYDFRDDDSSFKYYLFVKGEGYLDDILMIDSLDKVAEGHNKNLDSLFSNITEKTYETYEHYLDFDVNGNNLIDLEFDKNGTLQTGSNVDWGITQLYCINQSSSLDQCILDNVTLTHNAFYTNNKTGTIQTPEILLQNKSSIRDLYVVVNNVLIDKLENFNVKILTADNKSNKFIEVVNNSKINVLEVPVSFLYNYIKIVIEMPPNKIINSICVYARYAENDYSTPKITRNNTGSLISKIYDTTYESNFILEKLIGDIPYLEYVDLYIRGYKENNTSSVWTDWYRCELDSNLKIVTPHVFENYRFFQFKININNTKATTNIKKIVLKVVH